MNVYDTANKLAEEIKQSEEYMNFKTAKQAENEKKELVNFLENLTNEQISSILNLIKVFKTQQ